VKIPCIDKLTIISESCRWTSDAVVGVAGPVASVSLVEIPQERVITDLHQPLSITGEHEPH
jgi:hypothetical protein